MDEIEDPKRRPIFRRSIATPPALAIKSAKSIKSLIQCPVCLTLIKRKRLNKHLLKQHGSVISPLQYGIKPHAVKHPISDKFNKSARDQKANSSSTREEESDQKLKRSKPSKRAPARTPIAHSEKNPVISRTPCKKCGKFFSRMLMEIHIGWCHVPIRADAVQLPFDVLPQGSLDFRGIFEKSYQDLLSRRRLGVLYNWNRIREVELLGGIGTHCGRQGWLGYGVFRFPFSSRIVLETPVEGNATFILPAEWQKMIHLTKAELRKEYSTECTKVVHRGYYWRKRVADALREV